VSNDTQSAAALAAAFAGKSVFLTGHTGFKGSWLSIWLHQMGAKVSGYALAPESNPSNFQVSGVQKLLARHYEADLRDMPALRQAIVESQPDVIFHLGAQALVRPSYQTPRETFETNVMGTCNVLECVRERARPCTVIIVTSDKCYENREQLWGYRECDAMGGHDPYSASKGTAELVVASYRRSFFPAAKSAEHQIKVASARAGNVIGGGDWARDRIVPDIVQSITAGKPIAVRSPRSVRPWQHVLEPLSGYLTLAARLLNDDNPALCDGWNFGPNVEGNACVKDLVETFLETWGSGTWEDKSDPNQLHEAHLLRLSIEKAVMQLGWRPVWAFRETIRQTAAWYRKFYEGSRGAMHEACLADIARFTEQTNAIHAARPSPARPGGSKAA